MTSRTATNSARPYRTRTQVLASPHPLQPLPGSRDDPQRILAAIPRGHRDWKRILSLVVLQHQAMHARKHKGVSSKTIYERERFLFQFFHELYRETKYVRLDPRCLSGRHVEAMLDVWVQRGLSCGTIQSYLSMLRVFVTWIGKNAGMVRPLEVYVGGASPIARRRQAADHDHSWTTGGVDFAEVRARIEEICPYVAVQLEFERCFGLRAKEARCLRPHEAAVPRDAARPRDVSPSSSATHYLRLTTGTKGGRPRDVPIETGEQWDLLRRAQRLVGPGQHLGRPGFSLAANTSHYYRVLAKVGITKKTTGVTGHGLRHEFANDGYHKLSGVDSPARGGAAPDRPLDREARLAVSRLLGHNRPQITSCYLGSPRVAPKPSSPVAPVGSPMEGTEP